MEERRDAVHQLLRRARQAEQELELIVPGGGASRPDDSWNLGFNLRFPEDEPGDPGIPEASEAKPGGRPAAPPRSER